MPDACRVAQLLKIMTLVIDACVAVKLCVEEAGSEQAHRLIDQGQMIAPDIMLVEFAHAMWKMVRSETILVEAANINNATIGNFFAGFVPSAELIESANRLSFQIDHPVYDCLYLTLALQEEAQVVTADRKFWNAAKRAKLDQHVQLLEWRRESTG